MGKLSCFLIFLCLFTAPLYVQGQAQETFYVLSGNSLEVRYDDPAHAKTTRWQVWLFQEGVRIPRYTAGLQYSSWGLIEGTSPSSVVKQLKAAQGFEVAYLAFYGSGSWGRYTFLNPVGPIAITGQTVDPEPSVTEKSYEIYRLSDRVNKLVAAAEPSLENNDNDDPNAPVKEYFDQIRDVLQQTRRLLSQLDRAHPQLRFITGQIARTKPAVAQAESNVGKITAVLPSVRLPASKTWMSQTQYAGRDGTIEVAITETGAGVSVQQSWMGGDGSMTGTVIVTTIAYDDIGNIDLSPPSPIGDGTWTVRVYAAGAPFPQTIDSPQRRTVRAAYPAVNYTTTESSVYFIFPNSAEAHDAFSYFLYHKQLGR
jgi:hypothetical protein